ncbi:hypothetical protein BGZ63DRAFT_120725 [Mariannaea sp. PMI_226]|nr:hypothetical protein BGZ63DRAFT_120725 [Mariannaea sp. PMI_226]
MPAYKEDNAIFKVQIATPLIWWGWLNNFGAFNQNKQKPEYNLSYRSVASSVPKWRQVFSSPLYLSWARGKRRIRSMLHTSLLVLSRLVSVLFAEVIQSRRWLNVGGLFVILFYLFYFGGTSLIWWINSGIHRYNCRVSCSSFRNEDLKSCNKSCPMKVKGCPRAERR